MNYLELIVKDGTVTIPSIFMFEDWLDIDPFITQARKMNCTIVFENENLVVEPNNYESVSHYINVYRIMVSHRELGNAYVRYVGGSDKMSWDNVETNTK